MGFGFLFLGYFFLFSLSNGGFDMIPDILGFLIMYKGMRLLCNACPDNRPLGYAKWTMMGLIAFSGVILVTQLIGLFAASPLPAGVTNWLIAPLNLLYSLAIGGWHILFFWGIYLLAVQIELPKISRKARRNLALTAVYYLLTLISKTGLFRFIAEHLSSPDAAMSYMNFALWLLGCLWLLFNITSLFSCYMWICLEGDEDMPVRTPDPFDRITDKFKSGRK